MNTVDGFLVLDKPSGLTSHDVVARCRRIFSQRRIGHAGTLDPDATGVLLVGVGQVTRLLQFVSGLPKRYTGEVVFGVATASLDASGLVTGTWDMHHVSLEMAREAAGRLTGVLMQVPPMVSAVKVGGKRLHELARQGVEVERAPREVRVTRFDVEQCGPGTVASDGPGPVFRIDVECSSGTYVRSLAADLGAQLGGGAHLRALRRHAIGPFALDEAVTLEELEAAPHLLPPIEALRGMGQVRIAADTASVVAHGKVLPLGTLLEAGATGPGPWALVDGAGVLLAVYQAHKPGQVKPVVVLS